MYTLPQEIEVWYIIPAIRREIAMCLSKDHNASYDKIAYILGVSKAAVSQYIKRKRASRIKLHEKAMEEISRSCAFIARGKRTAVSEITRVLEVIRKKKLHCEICGEMIEDKYHDCKKINYPFIDNLND